MKERKALLNDKPANKFTLSTTILMVLAALALFLAGCGTQAEARPTEEEQIKNVVKQYFVREGNVPDYTVTIEAVQDNWARVTIAPTGVDNLGGDNTLYLQNQDQTINDAPPATLVVQPGNQGRVTTTSGWVVIAGPQAQFTDEELDAAGVPQSIRP